MPNSNNKVTKKILITGFDPFGGESINPAKEAVMKLPDQIKGHQLIKAEIPTVFEKSLSKISELVNKHTPDVLISIGQAGGRGSISIERVAINVDDARIADNEGNQPTDKIIREDGENAYFTTLPAKAIAKKLADNGIPSEVSNSAGTFVCNHVMYGGLYLASKKHPNMRSGFIHVPFLHNQVLSRPNTPSMSLDTIIKGLELAVEAIIENDTDISYVGGTIC